MQERWACEDPAGCAVERRATDADRARHGDRGVRVVVEHHDGDRAHCIHRAGRHHLRRRRAGPGCGSLCQQAAPAAGNQSACPPQGCLKCPQPDCFLVLSSSAQVAGGVFTVRVQCVWARPCDGGLSVWKASSVSVSDRLAGSEFSVPAGQTTNIAVGLTALGRQLIAPGSSYRGDVYVVVQGAGAVDAGYPQPTLLLQGEPAGG
jgi:hypothetical protein